MAKKFNIFLLSALAIILAACESALPRSGGRPYDVVIVSDNKLEGSVMMRELSECSEQFTTEEDMFKLTQTVGYGENDIIRLARCLIIVEKADIENTTTIREYNVWAEPQLVLYIKTPSAQQLAKDMKELKPLIADEINGFERFLTIKDIAGHRNEQLADSVEKYTSCRMFIPANMKIAKKEKGFIWLSDNNSDSRECICIYTVPAQRVDTKDMVSITNVRDSVMQKHIKGATEGMKFRIVQGTEIPECKNDTVIIKNMWEIDGDAMGGVAVCRIIEKGDSVMFAEAFLYSPATNKRNKMRRAEACLFTIKTEK